MATGDAFSPQHCTTLKSPRNTSSRDAIYSHSKVIGTSSVPSDSAIPVALRIRSEIDHDFWLSMRYDLAFSRPAKLFTFVGVPSACLLHNAVFNSQSSAVPSADEAIHNVEFGLAERCCHPFFSGTSTVTNNFYTVFDSSIRRISSRTIIRTSADRRVVRVIEHDTDLFT